MKKYTNAELLALNAQFEANNKAAIEGEIADEINPNFCLDMNHTKILVDIANGKIDLQWLAARILAGRGFDTKGGRLFNGGKIPTSITGKKK